jgi:hypothetical protein
MNIEKLSIELAVSISKAMQALYGDSFNRKWADVTKNSTKPENFISALQFGLSGLSVGQVDRGINVMRSKTFAPTIPEFRVWCLQGSEGFTDVNTAYTNAANQKYPDAATYETARRVGFFELRTRAETSTKPAFIKHYEAVCVELEINPNAFRLPEAQRIEQAPIEIVRKDKSFFKKLRGNLA